MIQQRVTKYIEKEHLFSPDDKILVALSGGADSVALLYILHTAGYHAKPHIVISTCEAKSQTGTSYLSANFAKEWKSIYIPLISTRPNMQRKNNISIEMAARELRYQWFEKIRKECQADVVAVAHHQDDSIETILLNLIRGTGITGLLGIPPP